MAHMCLRPGCTKALMAPGVCVGCANSEYEPQSDGVQYRAEDGTFVTTDPDNRNAVTAPNLPNATIVR